MARRPKAETKGGRTHRASATLSGEGKISAEAEAMATQEIDRIIARLDVEIPKAQQVMDELLARLRTTRIAT
jgi:hypothetical protein